MMLIVLFFLALLTAIISGVVGMAGGVTLMALLTLVYPASVIVPIHGVVQLASNFSRTYILRSNVRKGFFVPFLTGVPLGGVTAYFILRQLPHTAVFQLLIVGLLFWCFGPP